MTRARLANRAVNPLLERLPEWAGEFRSHQVQAIHEIVAAFDDVDLVVLDAPTGSGKTLIGETVRLILQREGTYVCTSKGLQDQFVRDYPYGCLLKGRGNYPTERFAERFHPDEYMGHLSCEDCTYTKSNPCDWCKNKSSCPYEVAKNVALRSDLIVTNTAYFLSECNSAGRLSGRGLTVVDEADTLESSLMGHVSLEIGRRRMGKLGWEPPAKVTVPDSWLEWVKVKLDDVDRLLLDARGKSAKARRGGYRARGGLEKWDREVRYLTRLRESLSRVAHGIETDEPWVYTGEGGVRDKREGAKAVAFKPSHVDQLGKEMVWAHGKKWLLMSATIISADEMLDSLGWDKPFRVVRCASTFPVANRPVLPVMVANVSRKTGDEGVEDACRAVEAIVGRHPTERVLVHTVSYKLADAIHGFLYAAGHGKRLCVYRKAADREDALTRYKNNEYGVLIASSMDRGVDLPEDLCRVQIIAKIPFPFLGDRQVSARLHSRNGQMWYNVQTVRSLVQMTGRAVRSETDIAVTYILDSQFQSMIWTRSRGLLPAWWSEAVDWQTGNHLRQQLSQ